MTALFLAPHNDDETLFGAYSILRHEGDIQVVTVLRSHLQELRGRGITAAMRENETRDALGVLGVSPDRWTQWDIPDSNPDWGRVEAAFKDLLWEDWSAVYVPAAYTSGGGHPHHDKIGILAADVFGNDRVTCYHTYVNGRGRVQGAHVPVRNPDWVRRKLMALACYTSQIREASTGHHFAQALDEWYA
jgi:LmbE family N-acetylglucosaminyl deacetylase